MIEVKGKAGIVARIIADSISEAGVRLTTFEIEYPRFVHSEILTHRMLSRNSASSRAIPFAKMQEQITARPVRFGEANKGMQDKGEEYDASIAFGETGYVGHGEYDYVCNFYTPSEFWDEAKESAINYSKAFRDAGYHKQVYNRLTEAFQMMKTVITGTEWDNFFWLRDDDAADPSIAELARCMKEAREQSVPQVLKAGQWHLPYVEWTTADCDGTMYYKNNDGEFEFITLENAIKISCARSCAVSFRNNDYGLEKSLEVFERLVGDEKKHGSALEHCATPMKPKHNGYYKSENVNVPRYTESWQQGISHVDREGNLWSGNFKGWVQYRKTVVGENYKAA